MRQYLFSIKIIQMQNYKQSIIKFALLSLSTEIILLVFEFIEKEKQ